MRITKLIGLIALMLFLGGCHSDQTQQTAQPDTTGQPGQSVQTAPKRAESGSCIVGRLCQRSSTTAPGIRPARYSGARLYLDARLLGMERWEMAITTGCPARGRCRLRLGSLDSGLLGFGQRQIPVAPRGTGVPSRVYGGVNYGYGYTGEGYQGGRWDNGNFYYNGAVNNISRERRITNVYNQPVSSQLTIHNPSYHGGRGGVTVQPTIGQRMLGAERHIQPTAEQAQHQSAARGNRALGASQNRGRPPIAATSRPGMLAAEAWSQPVRRLPINHRNRKCGEGTSRASHWPNLVTHRARKKAREERAARASAPARARTASTSRAAEERTASTRRTAGLWTASASH